MKLILLNLLLLMLTSLETKAQNCKSPCPYYNDFVSIAQADTVKNTQKKLNYYRAAIVAAKDCHCPELEQNANEQIDTLFVIIEAEKRKAEAQSQTILQQQDSIEVALTNAEKANKKNEKVIDAMDFYKGKFALAFKSEKYGFMNKAGETEIEFSYDKGEPFDQETGLAETQRGETQYLIDVESNEYKLIHISEILKNADNTESLIYQENIKWLESSLNNKTDVVRFFDEKIIVHQKNIKRDHVALEKEDNRKVKAYWTGKINKEKEALSLTSSKLKEYQKNRQVEIGARLNELRVRLDTIEVKLKIANDRLFNILQGGNEKLALDFSKQYKLDVTEILQNIVKNKFVSNKVEVLFLNETNLDTFPDFITEFENLKYIDISGTEIKFIPQNIDKLKKLKRFYFPDIIKEVPSSIYNLEKLECLSLFNTDYQILPEAIGKLKNLKKIYFPRRLRKIPESISDLENLETLYLGYAWVREIPEAIGKLKNLKTLALPHVLRKIPDSVYDLKNLETLFLCATDEREVPDAIEKLKKLRYLNIQIPVKNLPSSISNLENLKNLRLYDTELIRLPETIGDLIELEQLYLPGTIEEIPASIYKLKNLKVLSIPGVAIEVLPEGISNLVNLEQLDLTGTNLKIISEDIGKLVKLEDLKLPSSLEILPKGFENLINLTNLYIEKNPNLKHFPDISNFNKLRYFSYTLYEDEYYAANIAKLRELKEKFPDCAFQIKNEKGDYIRLQTEEEIYGDFDLDLPSMQEIYREIRKENRESRREVRKDRRDRKRVARKSKKE
jgi:leucine-rich repeat protein SHOC2